MEMITQIAVQEEAGKYIARAMFQLPSGRWESVDSKPYGHKKCAIRELEKYLTENFQGIRIV